MKKLFTSESVTCGHPDKMCDQISDAILDAYLKQDENARVACEVCISSNMVIIIGEITSTAEVDIKSIAKKTIVDIGYDNDDLGFNGHTCQIIVDTYGGYAHHGGGAFSGKDYTKVDRTASYYARYVAKNIVASGLAKKCEIQVSYAIGVATPVSIFINTFNTSKIEEAEISKFINNLFDFKPSSMIKKLRLKRPIYKQYASYGHFGREDVEAPWEEMDMVSKIKEIIKNN